MGTEVQVGGMGADPGLGAFNGHQGTDDPAVLKKPPRGLCTRWGSEGGCPFQPRLRHLLCFGFARSQTSKEVCGLALTRRLEGKAATANGYPVCVFPRVPVMCLCWGRRGHELCLDKVQEPAWPCENRPFLPSPCVYISLFLQALLISAPARSPGIVA